MPDRRPVKRVDIHDGAMYSEATGSFANACSSDKKKWAITHTDNTAFTGGVRVSF